jgi:hypothetical protein
LFQVDLKIKELYASMNKSSFGFEEKVSKKLSTETKNDDASIKNDANVVNVANVANVANVVNVANDANVSNVEEDPSVDKVFKFDSFQGAML